MKRVALWLLMLASILLVGVVEWPRPVLLVNVKALTMNQAQPTADALLMQGQHIVAVGTEARLRRLSPQGTQIIDLAGQTLLPGFVDAHSHFPSSGLAQAGLDLTPPPVGNVATLDILLDQVQRAADHIRPGHWIIGFNYDDASIPEERHPTRFELDEVAPDHPVYLRHRSGHMGVGNTLALKALGYLDSDNDGLSAQVGRDEVGRLSGLLQESAAPPMSTLLNELPIRRLMNVLLHARDEYLAAGVTTVQNGYADIPTLHLLRWSQRLGVLPQRVVAWPAHDKIASRLNLATADSAIQAVGDLDGLDGSDADRSASRSLARALSWQVENPQQMVLSAIKLIADGSPQGRTAWLTEPYLIDRRLPPGYRGFPQTSTVDFKALVSRYHSAGLQLALHGNGDAAIDLIIESLRAAQSVMLRTDARHIVVHAQTIRADQLEKLAQLGVGVSFFPAHTFFWGEWYRTRVLGEERAQQISPLALADRFNVPYTLHSDAPVTPISPMQILWSASTRQTLSGAVLGPELVISRERALKAMTLDAAWQNHLEADRGSLEAGKLADIIVLSGDPLRVDDVRSLRVQRVWIGGRTVYQRQSEDLQ